MWLISQNPIGINVELYYGIIGEENLRKEWLNWTNCKVLDLIGWLWEVGGLMCNYSQSQQISLTFILFKASRRESWEKIQHLSSLIPDHLSPSLSPSSSNSFHQ